jgi:hypothetical protein
MRSIVLLIVILLSIQTLTAQNLSLTQTVRGTIIDEQSGNSLKDVTVSITEENRSYSSISDSLGNFKLINVPIGRRTIKASMTGYEEAVIGNIEITSSKEIVLEIKLTEKVVKMDAVIIKSSKQKSGALNEAAVVSARQLSMDEAVRYSGTRNDPSRMAQNFAGVTATNDARNDIIIRGNSPAGVLWRMDGIDIPNPNHFSTLGSTGGPVTILNTNTLKNSDFITSAFPSQYGNAIAGVFDLRMRNGNNEKYEFTGEMGFNGFEFGAEGPISNKNKSSFLVDYRYSMVAAIQALGLSVGTGSSTPYYQDVNMKFNIPTKKAGTFSLFGLGGKSHIRFEPENQDDNNLYASEDGSVRDRFYKSRTSIVGLSHTYFFNPTTSGKLIMAASGSRFTGDEDIIEEGKPRKDAFNILYQQVKYSTGYTVNKKFNARNQLTTGVLADINRLTLKQDLIKNGEDNPSTLVNTKENALLVRAFTNYMHRFNDQISTNLGIYSQVFTLNNTSSIEPRWNIKYQFKANQSLSFGAGLHSQMQPLEVYFYQSRNNAGQVELTNRDLGFVHSLHTVFGYDINFSRNLRLKTEAYGQYIYDAAVETQPSSFSMLNAGADFGFPDKTNLVNKGTGYNYGVEFTLERFLYKGFYYLATLTLFESKYKGSDNVWRNTAFNTNYVTNLLVGKEFKLSERSSFGIDSKLAYVGGQRYTPFDLNNSLSAGYVIYKENEAYSLRNDPYWRWDFKISYSRNGRRVTQKWYIDFQNLTSNKNIYIRTLNPRTGIVNQVDQIGFFPNINYRITF